MSTFSIQKIANQFPAWTKARNDSSSVFQRFLSPFAEHIDLAKTNLFRFKEDSFLLKLHLGFGHLHTITLEEEDYLPVVRQPNGSSVITYPDVIGTLSSTDYTLTPVESTEEFFFANPTRVTTESIVSYTSLTTWDSNSPNTVNNIPYAERLTIEVKDSTIYNRPVSNNTKSIYKQAFVMLIGKDINGVPIEEKVIIPDDGVFLTKNYFTSLTKKPHAEGFNGRVTVGIKQVSNSYVLDPYHSVEAIDESGPLKIQIDSGLLHIFSDSLKLGYLYRFEGAESFENTFSLAKISLRNTTDTGTVTPVDMFVSYENTKLYVLGSDSLLYLYEIQIPPFVKPAFKPTNSSQISLSLIEQYPGLGSSSYLMTRHVKQFSIVEKVLIKRVNRLGVVEYVQNDLSWGTSINYLSGNTVAKTVALSWSDLRIPVLFNERGQWDFYLESYHKEGVYSSITSAMVSYWVAQTVIDPDVDAPIGCYPTREGYIGVYNAEFIHKIKEYADVYFAAIDSQQLFLKETYDAVEVTY